MHDPRPNTRTRQIELPVNSDELIPINKGDSFIVHATVYPAHKKSIFAIAGKALGIGALTYATEKAAEPTGYDRKHKIIGDKPWLLPVGVGLAFTTPDIIRRAKSSKSPTLEYYLYDQNKNLVSSGTSPRTKISKQGTDLVVQGKAIENGYLKLVAPAQSSETMSIGIGPAPAISTTSTTKTLKGLGMAKVMDDEDDDGGDNDCVGNGDGGDDGSGGGDDGGGGDDNGSGDDPPPVTAPDPSDNGNVDLPQQVSGDDADDFFDGYNASGYGVITNYDGTDGNAYYIYNDNTDTWTLNYWTGDADPLTVGDTPPETIDGGELPPVTVTSTSSFNGTNDDDGYITSDDGTTDFFYQYNTSTNIWNLIGGSIISSDGCGGNAVPPPPPTTTPQDADDEFYNENKTPCPLVEGDAGETALLNLYNASFGDFFAEFVNSDVSFSTATPPKGYTLVDGKFLDNATGIMAGSVTECTTTYDPTTGQATIGPITIYIAPLSIQQGAAYVQATMAHELVHALNIYQYPAMYANPATYPQWSANSEYAAYCYQSAVIGANDTSTFGAGASAYYEQKAIRYNAARNADWNTNSYIPPKPSQPCIGD